ncbi:MAG: hypothetical protein BMS9Abin11_1371 [Gammaproteobacteria bacterium]|nr:MAG: hypothetical protein BMS9Abin11_1371 [Gammaproteobacteria bacterium]
MREQEALIIVGLFFLFIILVWYVVNVFYLLTLNKALKRVDTSRRGMSPGMVWLNLIPLFNLGWHIYTVVQMSDALAKEFDARQIGYEGKPGYVIGLVASILMATSIIPYLGGLLFIGGVVCGIVYWVQIADFSKKIALPA